MSRIAKNTLFLYTRMLVYIAVNLFTVRILWNVLGVDDYGIFNVVGGIVMLFAFLNGAMVASSQRFISFGLGKGDMANLRKIFSISVSVHMLIAGVVLLLAETVGLWFLNARLNIPPDRMIAANWVYQCSVIAFLLNVVSVPYNACIVAHEHMKVYGYFGILDVFLRLGIVLLLLVVPFDRLICYAIFTLLVSALMRIIYMVYCRQHFEECRPGRFRDRHLMRDMFAFAGWSFLGNMGFSVRDQGINIILNLFFSVAVNAAKGVANQVGGVINSFSSNFTMAVNPQITKRYAAGEIDSMLHLLYHGCKYSLLLMALVVVPLLFCAEPLLQLWLGNVAPYTVGFLRLILILALIDCVVSPVTTSLQATGNIRRFQIIIAIIMVATIPVAYLSLRFISATSILHTPYIVMYIAIASGIAALIARLILLREQIRTFSPLRFLRIVYLRTLPTILLSLILSYLLASHLLASISDHTPLTTAALPTIILFIFLSLLITLLLTYFISLTSEEKKRIRSLIPQKLKRS